MSAVAMCGREVQMSETMLLGKREAARTLSISIRTLDGLIAAHELPTRRIGRRVLIARRHLEQFALNEGRQSRTRAYRSACPVGGS